MDRVRITAVATMMALSGPVFAQQQPAASPPPPVDFSKVEIETTDLGNNCYMLEGEGGNITVAVANDGIIMVDSQYARCTTRSRPPLQPSRNSRSNISSIRVFTATTPAAMNCLRSTASSSSPKSTSGTGSRREPPMD